MEKNKIRFSIIVIHRNGFDLLHSCLLSIIGSISNNDEIILIDNNSSDDSMSKLKSTNFYQKIKIIANKCNFGYGESCNQGMKAANGKYFILCNNDVKLNQNALTLFYEYLNKKNIGIIGPQMLTPSGSYMNSYSTIPFDLLSQLDLVGRPRRSKEIKSLAPVENLRGACLAVNKEMVKELGGYDEDFYFYHEETEWCFRINQSKNWKVMFSPEIKIFHIGGGTTENVFKESRIEFFRSRIKFWQKIFPFRTRLLVYLINLPKLLLDLIFYCFMTLVTFGKVKTYRRKVLDRSIVLVWLVLGMPKKWGLQDKCN